MPSATQEPTREWRRKRYRRTRRDWMMYTGLALLALVTGVMVAMTLMR